MLVGLLRDAAPSWGTHENYLTTTPPERLTASLLPFLATRIFAGAGGIHWPSGDYVVGTRIALLQQDAGGNTQSNRALCSTGREESLSTDARHRRLQLILGDGNRSQFSLALKVGTTALVVRLLEENPAAISPLPGTPAPQKGRLAFWMQAASKFNRLASGGEPLQVDRQALAVQRVYLERCHTHFAGSLAGYPWISRLLNDWEITLGALASHNDDWLARRLDPWFKHRLCTEYLRHQGLTWATFRGQEPVAVQLALLNQQYHTFAGEGSLFAVSEAEHLLDHRVTPFVPPGAETEPYVPDVHTRAQARARFRVAQQGAPGWQVDWHAAYHKTSETFLHWGPCVTGASLRMGLAVRGS